MKNQFELHIFLSNLDHVLNLEETLRIIPRPDPAFVELMDQSLQVNQTSLSLLKDYMYKYYGLHYEGNFEGIYFGQETCEGLIPSLKHVKEASDYCRENELQFTLVTPYVSPKGINRLHKLLEYLNAETPNSEVVVNDFGVLHLLNTKYSGLTPVMGRLLNKMKRDPRFSVSGYDIANVDIKNMKRVEQNQEEVLVASSYEIPVYQEFLKGKGVARVGTDTLSQLLAEKTFKKWKFPVDLYWPWTYITSSRSCAVAAFTQPGKETHPTDEPCMQQCKKYEFNFNSDKKMLPTVLRGNAVWMSTRSLYDHYFKQGFHRLVFQPYIPV